MNDEMEELNMNLMGDGVPREKRLKAFIIGGIILFCFTIVVAAYLGYTIAEYKSALYYEKMFAKECIRVQPRFNASSDDLPLFNYVPTTPTS